MRHPTYLRTVPVLVAVALLGLAGCGRDAGQPTATAPGPEPGLTLPAGDPTGDPTSAAPVDAPDPCALVTQEEAEELAGTRLDPGKLVRETCTYTGPVDGPTAQVEVFVGDGAKKFLDIERELGHQLRPLSGVGDEAYAGDEAVFVNRAGLWVSVRLVRLNDPAENREPLTAVARTVAGRI